jgi:7-cyano-7-deazaguanine synthase
MPEQQSNRPAVVLLSGGLDSATCVAIAQDMGFVVNAISFRYGQRHAIELERAEKVAQRARVVRHIVVDIDLAKLGGSALTDQQLDVPKHDHVEDIGGDIPLTYVPARNTVFLSYALAWAEVLGSSDIFLGVNALDYSGYPDCRPEFISAYETMANLATKQSVNGNRLTIHAPLIHWTKGQIIQRGLELGVDYSLTISCYDPSRIGGSCGRCDSCLLRAKGFRDVGISDPANRN